jgi:hypothetical protein
MKKILVAAMLMISLFIIGSGCHHRERRSERWEQDRQSERHDRDRDRDQESRGEERR